MTESIVVAERPRVFRGWWVLAGIFLVMTAGSGFAFYAQGVFLDALVAEQGFSVGMAGAGTGMFFLVSGVAGYYAGSLISRFDIRAVIVVGATFAALGIVLLGQVRTEWQMFLVFILYGAGYAFNGLVPATSLVTRWFHVKRSVALSIASTGLSVGGIAITPFIAQLIDERSLVELAPWLAICYWVAVVVPTVALLRPSPESLGLRPDGAVALAAGVATPAVAGVDFATAVGTRFFRLLSAGFVLIMGAQVGAIQHVFKLTKDAFDVDVASLALVVITSTSVMARLAGGVAATRIPIRQLISVLIVVQAIGIAVIGLANAQWSILLGVVILGVAMGNLLMLHPLILAEAFGVREYPRIYGLAALLMVTGVGLGPFVVGVLRDAASYRTAFLTMSVVALVGFLVFRMAGWPDRSWAVDAEGQAPDDSATGEVAQAAEVDTPVGVGAWNPDPSWQAPSVATNGASRLPLAGSLRQAASPPPSRLVPLSTEAWDDERRFRRPPTILPEAPNGPGSTTPSPSAAMAAPPVERPLQRRPIDPDHEIDPIDAIDAIDPSPEPAPAAAVRAADDPSDPAGRLAMPVAVVSTTVAVGLMAWIKWMSRNGSDEGSGPKQP